MSRKIICDFGDFKFLKSGNRLFIKKGRDRFNIPNDINVDKLTKDVCI